MIMLNLEPSVTPEDFCDGVYLDEYAGETENNGESIPWEDSGYKIFSAPWGEYTPHRAAQKTWGIEQVENVPIIRWTADFYLLDAIAAQVPQGRCVTQAFSSETVYDWVENGMIPETSKRDDLLSLRAMYLQERLTRKLTPILEGYLWFAAAGEVVYHYGVCTYLSTSCEDRCRILWKRIVDKVGKVQAATWMKQFFLSGNGCGDDWEDGYGGPAWADCVEPLLLLDKGQIHGHKFTPKNFCDRVFSLQHNGGTVLDKTMWRQDPEYMHLILDAHAESNWHRLEQNASPQVRALFQAANSPDVDFSWTPTNYPTFKTKNIPDIVGCGYDDDSYCCEECNGY